MVSSGRLRVRKKRPSDLRQNLANPLLMRTTFRRMSMAVARETQVEPPFLETTRVVLNYVVTYSKNTKASVKKCAKQSTACAVARIEQQSLSSLRMQLEQLWKTTHAHRRVHDIPQSIDHEGRLLGVYFKELQQQNRCRVHRLKKHQEA